MPAKAVIVSAVDISNPHCHCERSEAISGRYWSPSIEIASSPSAPRNDNLILPKCLAQQRHDALGVELQKARLVGAGGVEDEVTEAQFDIGADLGDLLLGVAGDDPAAGGAVERQ